MPKARQYILRLYPDRDAALIEALQAARESKRGGVQGLLRDALSAYLALTAKGLSPPVPAIAPDTGSVHDEVNRPGEDAVMHAAAEALHRRLSIPLPAAQALAKAPPLASALRLLRNAMAFRPDYLTEIEAVLLLEAAERLRNLVEEARKRRPALRSLEVES